MNFSLLWPPLIIAGAGIAGIASMAINLRKARTIEDTPLAKIRSAAQGYVGISGFARALDSDLLKAPLSGKNCVWYRYTIERYESSNRRASSDWSTVESGSSEQLFALDDNTGVCHIDPRRADVTTDIKQRWEGDQRHPVNGAAPSLLGGLFGQKYRYTEFRIHPDEWVYALGWYETLHAPSWMERTAAQTKLLLNQWKQNRDTLLAQFDRNGDGAIDMQEWEQARQAAQRIAQQQVQQQPEQPPINVISETPLRDKPFLIASTDPRELASRYRRNAVIALLAGLGFSAFALWNFYYR
ncbi:MAG: hypothetical protein JWM78_1391 [Verrucomicrobiaceae bacterium]|nr:hypothetical protein [Verrucomicrobiaceae bacterium]